jgi:membrane protein
MGSGRRSGLRATGELLRETASRWYDHNAFRLAASLAFYTLFSLAPLLVLAVALAGAFFGEQAVRGHVVDELRGLIGDESAVLVQRAIADASLRASSLQATVFGVLTLLFASTIVVSELQDALNTIWKARPDAGWNVLALVKKRLLSLAIVAVVGFLLVVSLVATTVLNVLGAFVLDSVSAPLSLLRAANFAVSFVGITVLFAAVYKVLPDVRISWRDVWVGAGVTSALFVIGKMAIGAYLGGTAIASTYGAAGSLATILVWVYYSALIVLFGAEFTYVWSRRRISAAAGGASSAEAVRSRDGASVARPRASSTERPSERPGPDGRR